MPFTKTWNEAAPAGGDDASNGDNEIRDGKFAIRERLAVDHYFYDDESGHSDVGYHKQVTMPAQSTPTTISGALRLYAKSVSSVEELHLLDDAGNERQWSKDGLINAAILKIASEARGDILYKGATLWQRLAVGTNGQVLKSDGTDPVWGDLGFQTAASQVEMEAANLLTVPVTPGRLQYHPGVAKAWCIFDGSNAGTFSPAAGHNVASITKTGTGLYTVTFTTAFSSANYSLTGTCKDGEVRIISLAAGSANIQTLFTRASGDGAIDSTGICITAHGDQ